MDESPDSPKGLRWGKREVRDTIKESEQLPRQPLSVLYVVVSKRFHKKTARLVGLFAHGLPMGIEVGVGV